MPRSYGKYTVVISCVDLRSFESIASRLPCLNGIFDERCTAAHDKVQFHYTCDLNRFEESVHVQE